MRRGIAVTIIASIALGIAMEVNAGIGKKEKPVLVKKVIAQAAPSQSAHPVFDHILKTYTFVGDFGRKEPERPISKLIFWRYPFKAPPPDFSIDKTLGDGNELPASAGKDRGSEHLNRGRVYFKEGNFAEAKTTWLSARARYGDKHELHRRTDYFIAISFMRLANQLANGPQDSWVPSEVRLSYSNAATFLSWAFIKKRDIADPLLDQVAPRALYDLAAIYNEYGRYTGAHSAIVEGLNFLRKTGRSDLRPRFRRMLAESWIRNGDYIKALQELDTAIRQDPDPKEAVSSFSRAGDIYFDLNNYELAEDVYAMSHAIGQEATTFVPESSILRGETLFWLGKFDHAQSYLWFGLNELAKHPDSRNHFKIYGSWAMLRIADAFLARANAAKDEKMAKTLIEQAKLAYFKVRNQYPGTEPASVAEVRELCLEEPTYTGSNVAHARDSLAKYKTANLPYEALELAWSCLVASQSREKQDQETVAKVREFVEAYPESTYNHQFVQPVIVANRKILDEHIARHEHFDAIKFFETYRKQLFTEVSESQQVGLFIAYVESFQSRNAIPFLDAFQKSAQKDDWFYLRATAFASETYDQLPEARWQQLNRDLARTLKEHKFALEEGSDVSAYFHRIFATKSVTTHMPWIYGIVRQWGNDFRKNTCSLTYQILSQWNNVAGPEDHGAIYAEITDVVDTKFPKIFKIDKECAASLLNLEFEAGQDRKLEYSRKWLARTSWPVSKITIALTWSAAESLADLGDSDSSVRLWQFLAKEIPDSYPESQLAKLRLDPARAQVEDLWR